MVVSAVGDDVGWVHSQVNIVTLNIQAQVLIQRATSRWQSVTVC